MKKRVVSFLLTLALCLGLAVPAFAADTSGLDAQAAEAFYSQLAAYQQVVLYADLRDMNGDKSPELVVISAPQPDGNSIPYHIATVDIWQIKNGKAVKTSSAECGAGTDVGMGYISLNGMLYLHAFTVSGRPGFHGVTDTYISPDGWEYLAACWYDEPASMDSESIADEINSTDFFRGTNGNENTTITREAYKNYIQKYRAASSVGDSFLCLGGQSWYNEEHNDPSYQTVLSLLSTKANEKPVSGFTDVKSSAYYAEAVKWAVDKKVTSGTSASTFSPEKTCSVAEILTFLWRAKGQPEPTIPNPFSDIKSSDYYYKAALWAKEKGLVSGNRFNPNAPCSRSMVVTYLWKLAGSPNVNGYSARTITGTQSGEPCSIDFSAAIVEDTTITKIYIDELEKRTETREQVTLITVAPESKMAVKDGLSVAVRGCDEADGIYYFAPICDTEISSEVYPSADEIKYYFNAWELVGFQDKNGNPCMINVSSKNASFHDVPAVADYAQAVVWAVRKNITSGTSDTTFSPGKTCTRGEIVTFLYRAMAN